MKIKSLKHLLLVALLVLCGPAAMGYTFSGGYQRVDIGDFVFYARFSSADKVCSLDGLYQATSPTEVVFPSTITYKDVEYKVVALTGDYASEFQSVTKITLPSELETIGSYAFRFFPNVEEIDIPETVTAFEGNPCYGLRNTRLRFHTATPPTAKKSFTGSSSNHIKMIVPAAAFRNYSLADYYEDECIIADNWQQEGAYSTVKTGVVDDGELGYIVVSDQLPNIRTYSDVNKLIVEKGHINADDFYQIRQMHNLIYLDLSGLSIEDIPADALRNCWQIEEVILPPTIKTIGGYAFYNTGLTALELPEAVESMTGSYTFSHSIRLEKLIFHDGITALPGNVCSNCVRLHEVTLPSKLATMGTYAFEDCDIYDISLPGTLTQVPSYAFRNNYNLTHVDFHEGTQVVGSYAFTNDRKLDNIVLPTTIRTIKDNAFQGCTSLASLQLTEGLENIQDYAFSGCTALTEITLPSSLQLCYYMPFTGCKNLQTINTYALIPPTVHNYVPTSDAGNIQLNVPLWSFQEYMTTPGWLEYQDHTAITEHLPENIVINKDFEFVLRQGQLDANPEYRPNLRMMYNTDDIDDGFGHTRRERGNLTIGSTSGKMNVDNFSMYVSPFAKYFADQSRFYYGYDYDYNRTDYNPNSLVVLGNMRAEHQTLNLLLMNDRWQFVSFPFDVKVADINPVDTRTQWVVRAYDGAARAQQLFDETWVNLTADSILHAGRGYIMKCYNADYSSVTSRPVEFVVQPIDHTLSGQNIFTNTDVVTPLAEYAIGAQQQEVLPQNRSWNLIGNPYPCYYDTRRMGTEAIFLVWDSYNRTYAAFDPTMDSYILNPGEAFFIQRPVDDNDAAVGGELFFSKAGRQTYRNPNDMVVLEVKSQSPQTNERRAYDLVLTDGTLTDRTRVVFSDKASLRYEVGHDAPKFKSDDTSVPQLWTMGGTTEYAINQRPVADGTVQLTLRLGTPGQYTIRMGEMSAADELYLVDNQLHTTTLLNDTEGYTFQSQGGQIAGRFAIVLKSDSETAIQATSAIPTTTDAYDLSGRRAAKGQKGIIVSRGRKVLK